MSDETREPDHLADSDFLSISLQLKKGASITRNINMERIQRRRGVALPSNVAYVGRPTKWGNPNVIQKEKDGTYSIWSITKSAIRSSGIETKRQAHVIAVELYELALIKRVLEEIEQGNFLDFFRDLRDKDGLACWCDHDLPCHVDTLIEMIEKSD